MTPEELTTTYQYDAGDIDQSTFLNLMAQIAELHELYEQGLINDDQLDEALTNTIPAPRGDADGGDADGGTVDDWVRTLAGWWAEGLVSDAEFLAGIEYLIEQGVITIGR